MNGFKAAMGRVTAVVVAGFGIFAVGCGGGSGGTNDGSGAGQASGRLARPAPCGRKHSTTRATSFCCAQPRGRFLASW